MDATIDYEPHVGQARQYVRDVLLGVNDGLVSTILLVAGVVGGNLSADQVLLTGVAGAIAGAVSMAAGEYLATRSQEQVFDREIALEMRHIEHFRDEEVAQLRGYFTEIGLRPEDIEPAMDAFSHNDEALLNAMKVFEFGVVDSERRNPLVAMVTSGLLFFAGAIPAVAPFLFTDSAPTGLLWASILTAVALFAVGLIKSRVTDENSLVAGAQNLLIAGVGGVAAYVVGALFGTALS